MLLITRYKKFHSVLQAGFALAIILLILMAGICLYSCYLILKCAEDTGTVQVLAESLRVHNKVLYGKTPAQASPRGGGDGNCLGGD